MDEIIVRTGNLLDMFYKGDRLSPLELDIEQMYISEKLDKHNNYKRRKSSRYQVKWTYSDFNRY